MKYTMTATGCTPISYQKYYNLLQSTTHKYGATVSKIKKTRRSVHISGLTYDYDPNSIDNELLYDIAVLINLK